MLGGIFEKAITATISLGMMLFSSYQGNTPSFAQSRAFSRGNQITVQATLESAFNEDFRQIMQSGQRIPIDFTLTLRSEVSTEIISFQHIAIFDPLLGNWTLICEEQNNRTYVIDSWSEFKNANSDFHYQSPHELELPIEVNLVASLPIVTMGQNNESFDLMIFWNFHKPNCNEIIL
ncbi:MAG: hypothetical protein RAO94_06930 [Candidatus Stygibacter australis]|nr:hypothetical protein [Candidatus Stygibacter australis]MDP8322066.1 hypothetical protein [Candidatus Stygibacter australis]